MCGDAAHAEKLAGETSKVFPNGTIWNVVQLPQIRAAIALKLLFGVPLFVAGLLTAVVAFGILGLQSRGYRRFELVVAALLGVILLFLFTWVGVFVGAAGVILAVLAFGTAAAVAPGC